MQVSNFRIPSFSKLKKENILNPKSHQTNPINFKASLESDCVELEMPKKAPTREEIVKEEVEKRINRPHIPISKALKNDYRKAMLEASGLGFTKEDLENQNELTKQIVALEPSHKTRIGSTTYFTITPTAKEFIRSKTENKEEVLDCTYLQKKFGIENDELEILLRRLGTKKTPYPKGTFQDKNLEKYYIELKSDLEKEVFEDLRTKRVAPRSKVVKGSNLSFLPLRFKSYQENGKSILAMPLVDLENEENRKVIDGSSEYRGFLGHLGFSAKTEKIGDMIFRYIDMEDEKNQATLKATSNGVPKKNPNYYGDPTIVRLVPVDFLATQGCKPKEYIETLVLEGKFKGKVEEKEGKRQVFIEVNPESYQVLTQLRRKNQDISSPSICAKALGISVERLREATYFGDFEVLPECYTPYGLLAHFLDVSTPKNKSFIQKTQFEQTFISQRLLSDKGKIKQKGSFDKLVLDVKLLCIKGNIAYSLSPKTRESFERLVLEDETFKNLLIKQEEGKTPLTPEEKAYLRGTKRAFWEETGTEELEEGFKKAQVIMKAFEEGGLENVPEKLRPVFEKYNIKKY